MATLTYFITVLACISGLQAFSEPNAFKPVIWSKLLENDRPAFHGEIKENERTVQLKPELSATDADEIGGAKFICSYGIEPIGSRTIDESFPFEINVLDRTIGRAEIRVKEGRSLNYEEKTFYKFNIIAHDCGSPSQSSEPAVIKIMVLDVDEFAPVFDDASYFANVEEGKMYDSIVKIHARDSDSSEAFKTICGYELLTPGVPFELTTDGHLRNKEPLDFNIHHNFILEAVAKDCGGRSSGPVFINLAVQERCRSGWSGLKDVINYRAGSGQQRLAEGAALGICDGECTPQQVNVKLTLATKHIGKGCDRDTYSVISQRKLCGASGDTVDLLPSPESSEWTHNIPTDDGHEMDQVFAFDGHSNALEVPESIFNHVLHKHFTISAWLRHDDSQLYDRQSKSPKEHIVCMSDGDGMSRHHYGLYIHGEKLVLLLRREAEDVTSPKDMQVFRPAEFRWHIPQVVDDQWHHYAVSVDFDENDRDGGVRLYIDGKLLLTDDDNFEIIDDWPLHKTKKVHSTKLVVGACWQGRANTFANYYKGYMAGLFVLKGKTESDRVIKCLNNCKENLDFHAINDMSSGTSVSFNNDMTEFTISSRSVEEVNRLMGQVAYVNSRNYPTPGYRTLNIETSIICEGQTIVLPLLEKKIMVQEQQQPMFVITGYSNLTRMVYEFERGLRIFHDIHIFAQPQTPEEEMDDEEDNGERRASHLAQKLSQTLLQQPAESQNTDFMIDECHVKADPPLNLLIEHLSLPAKQMEMLGLDWRETNNGVVIKNADTIPNYENVIRNIHYYHSKPEKLANRTLTLYCSSQNQRFISTKFIERLVAVHQYSDNSPAVPQAANAQKDTQGVHQSLSQSNRETLHTSVAASSNLGMVAIIVVCVGFLLFMIVMGVIRIRAAHRRTQVVQVDDKEEMEWDNSGLNITVNPMEQEQMFEYEDGAHPTFPEESDSEDDEESSMQGDYGDSTDDDDNTTTTTTTRGKGPNGDLEWDHTSF